MAETEPSAPRDDIVAAFKPMEGVPTYYVNSVHVLIGPYDLTLTMQQLAGLTADGAAYEPLARVIMSPQHAKVLAEILAERVAQYEDAYGALLSHEEMKAAGKAAKDRGEAMEVGDATEAAKNDSTSEPEPPS